MIKFRGLAVCLILLVVGGNMQGCAYSVHQNQISDFQPYAAHGSGNVVSVEVKDHVIFADTSRFDLVDKAYAQLMARCPTAPIVGISTVSSTALGFFSWYNRIRMQGLCLSKSKAAKAATASSATSSDKALDKDLEQASAKLF